MEDFKSQLSELFIKKDEILALNNTLDAQIRAHDALKKSLQEDNSSMSQM